MERKLNAETRAGTGKGAARKMRAAGRVPAVVYGHRTDPVHVTVDARELFHILHTDAGMNVLVDLRLDGDRFLAMPREVQRDHLRGRLLHVDFLRVARDEKIAVDVPVNLVGDSHGVREGGVLEHHLWTVRLEALPQEVPEAIDADVSSVGLNESLKVGDLTVPDNLTVLTPPEETIVSVVPPQVLRVEEEIPEGLEETGPGAVGEEGDEQAAEPGSQA